MNIPILDRWTRAVLWAGEARSLGAAVMAAIEAKADLAGANLAGANLAPIRDDFFAVLDTSPREVSALRVALEEGRVDGSTYEGECACLVGTIANAQGCRPMEVPGLRPDSERLAERWFLAIRPGLGWIDEWTTTRAKAVAT